MRARGSGGAQGEDQGGGVMAISEPQVWRSCRFEEHVEDLRLRQAEAERALDLLVDSTDRAVFDAYRLLVASVEELLEHLGGVHADDCPVRLVEEGEP